MPYVYFNTAKPNEQPAAAGQPDPAASPHAAGEPYPAGSPHAGEPYPAGNDDHGYVVRDPSVWERIKQKAGEGDIGQWLEGALKNI